MKHETYRAIRNALQLSPYWGEPVPSGSIMGSDDVCECDDNIMCEHRVEKLMEIINMHEQ
jgi:hypothetical protein